MVRMQKRSVLHLCTKFEADSSFRSKLSGSQNLEIRSPDPGHAHLGDVLWSVRREGPFSMSVPNFKRIALFVQKLLGVPKFLNSFTWPRPRPLRGRSTQEGPSSISVPNLKQIAQFVQKLLRGSQNLEIRSRDPGHAHIGVVL